MATKFGLRAMTRGSFTHSTGAKSTAEFSCRKSYRRCDPNASVATILPRRNVFWVPVITPASTRSMTPSDINSVWTPRSR